MRERFRDFDLGHRLATKPESQSLRRIAMTDAARIPDLNALLRNDAWMRRLAARLVNNTDDAEDLVQEALLVAVASPPQRPGRLDAWLRRVLCNLATHLGRRERERPARERMAARDEAQAVRG